MTTAFVLTGGGSLGAVQVGMLQALSAYGVRPDLLVGTSSGAMNAAWVAGHGMSADSLAELASIWTGLRRTDVFPVDPGRVVRGLLGLSSAVSSLPAPPMTTRTGPGEGRPAASSAAARVSRVRTRT